MTRQRHAIIPIFVPHKGCPHDCIFCNQKKISGEQDEVNADKVIAIIEKSLETIKPDTYTEVGFYGGSFTGIEQNLQKELLNAACKFVISGRIKSIRLSTRPDYINKQILDFLKEFNVGLIELGAQSLDDEVLSFSCRGHNAFDVRESSKLIRESGIGLGLQMMTGLPFDTNEKSINTAKEIIKLKPTTVRIYPSLVIKETALERLYLDGKYFPQKTDSAADLCATLLELFYQKNIRVIRVGLQNTDLINLESQVVAGPFHPAFRQLAESKLFLKEIEAELKNSLSNIGFLPEIQFKTKPADLSLVELIIFTSSSNISNVIGQNKTNISFLMSKYSFSSIKVVEDDTQDKRIRILLQPRKSFQI